MRPEVARAYAAMLSARITPVVREYGSLGCSGDLAPLAHCALAATGEGTVRVAGGPEVADNIGGELALSHGRDCDSRAGGWQPR